MTEKYNTIIIGGGQAGLITSYLLKKSNIHHSILEQAEKPAFSWREQRWDSFCFVIPNWALEFPGGSYRDLGLQPDDFILKEDILKFFEQYITKHELPIQFNQKVTEVVQKNTKWYIKTESRTYECEHVVVATGFFHKVKIPSFASKISPHIVQLDVTTYKNPNQLSKGPVLIIGSGQSGMQITQELLETGIKVYLSIGSTGRIPRRYRGNDTFKWLVETGFFEKPVNQLSDLKMRNKSNPQVSGRNGGLTVNLHDFYAQGVTLLGHVSEATATSVKLSPDVQERLQKNDDLEKQILNMIDSYILKNNIKVPEEKVIHLTDGYEQEVLTELDLEKTGIKTIIWTCGFDRDYSIIQTETPIVDDMGYPIQTRGISPHKGLYFIGMPWIHTASSGFVLHVGRDAEYLSKTIIQS